MKMLSLSHKVTLIVIAVFALSALMTLATQRLVIMPSFLELEETAATRNSERVLEAIRRELDAIAPTVSDWSNWTDSYQFAKGEYPQYVDSNLSDPGVTLGGTNMNYLGIYNTAGQSMWSQGWDNHTARLVDLGELMAEKMIPGHPLLQPTTLDSTVKGIINTAQGPLLVVSRPILTSERTGPSAGTLIMGRFLNEAAFRKLSDQTRIDVSVKAVASSDQQWISVPGQDLLHDAPLKIQHEDVWQLRTTLGDVSGVPILSVDVLTPRDISAEGAAAIDLALISLAATGMITMIVLWYSLHRVLLKPISSISQYTVAVGDDENLLRRLDFERPDEVGTLANNIDAMVDKLQEARRKLVEQSYRSGIAEMASGVLHNIGNAITPLNVRLLAVSQTLRAVPTADMERAVAELADPSTPAERRVDLQMFVELVSVEMIQTVNKANEEIVRSVQQVNLVQEILIDQERASRSERVIETLDVDELVRSAANTLNIDVRSRLRLIIEPDVAACGYVSGSQAALKQVVSNLMLNAVESIEASGSELGKLVISAERMLTKEQSMTRLQFLDNGAGISKSDLEQLFVRGFSTKNREGSGYGLHWSANTLKSMGGWMSADSNGPGKGACFTIHLPAVDVASMKATGTEG